jgi:uncharacterized protein (TIRG00374 family)
VQFKFWLGILVSAVAVAALLYQVDLAGVAAAFGAAHYVWLIPAVVVVLLAIVIRVWRWPYLLKGDLQASFEGRLSATFIGFMANGLLPARMGEFVRAWCLGHREGKSKSAVFASIVVERLLDGLWILLYLVLVLWVVPFPEGSRWGGIFWEGFSLRAGLRWAGFLSLAFYGGMILFLILMRLSREKALRVLGFCLKPISVRLAEKVRRTLEGFIHGLYLPPSLHRILIILFYTAFLWGVGLGGNYFTLRAFDLNFPWHAPFLLLVFQAIGVMIPSSPGFVGTYHAMTVLGVQFYGASKGVALSFAIVVHMVSLLPIILVGLGFLWKENLSFGQLIATREEPAA